MLPSIDWGQIRQLLCRLQSAVLDRLLEARNGLESAAMARVSDVTMADTIYAVDSLIEERILEWMREHWPARWPVELLMEGLEERGPVTFPEGTAVANTLLKLIIDPIDGTREIMWDRRSAWALAGVAPQRGNANRLADLQVAAMTELPTTRSWRSDQLSAVRGGKLVAESVDTQSGRRRAFTPRPFDGTSLLHGFAGLCAPFPVGKRTVAAITETLFTRLEPDVPVSELPVFDDQYLCTGGLFHDLITGRLRFYGDLRPEVFTAAGMPAALCAHPYDVCTALVAEAAGVVISGLDGNPLDGPLDTTSPITWIGYANDMLANRIQPVLEDSVRSILRP